MARLPYVNPATRAPPVREALEVVPPLNIFRTMAHAETALPAVAALGRRRCSASCSSTRVLRELAILRVARLTPHAEYEWVQHVPIARAVGVTRRAGRRRSSPTTRGRRLRRRSSARCCASPREVVATPAPRTTHFAAVRESLSPREIVELLIVIGQYMMLARVMATVEIDIDEPAGTAVLDCIDQRRS